MALGQIGPITAVLEGLATTVGAGMLLGGFVAGVVGVVAGWPRPILDAHVLFSSYAGGVGGMLLVLADTAMSYIR
jgi:hypothetical protein